MPSKPKQPLTPAADAVLRAVYATEDAARAAIATVKKQIPARTRVYRILFGQSVHFTVACKPETAAAMAIIGLGAKVERTGIVRTSPLSAKSELEKLIETLKVMPENDAALAIATTALSHITKRMRPRQELPRKYDPDPVTCQSPTWVSDAQTSMTPPEQGAQFDVPFSFAPAMQQSG